MTVEAFLCDAVRTPIGRYAGSLAAVRADDLAAVPLAALKARHAGLDWQAVDDVIYGCANQAGEDNRDVARMALLLAGLPDSVPGATVNRLCGSGMEAIAMAARAIRAGDGELMLAGGVESMSRAPFVMGKATSAFARDHQMYDTTIGWRFVNPKMHAAYGTDSMPETAENVAAEFALRAPTRMPSPGARSNAPARRSHPAGSCARSSPCRCRMAAKRSRLSSTSIRGQRPRWSGWPSCRRRSAPVGP